MSLVDIVMTTYNQAQYVAQAIESVLMQRCNFSYRLLIRDDCSTDNTFELCKEYQERYSDCIFVYQSDKNEGIIQNYIALFDLVKAPYVSILEGDDYWVDETKLQRHADILNNNHKIGLVHGASFRLVNGELIIEQWPGQLDGRLYERLIKEGNCIYPLTTLFRKELIDGFLDTKYLLKRQLLTIDYFLWLEFANHCQFYYDAIPSGVYRIIPTSISNSNKAKSILDFHNTEVAIVSFYLSKYPIDKLDERGVYFSYVYATAWKLLNHGFIRQAAILTKNFGVFNKRSFSLFLITHNSLVRMWAKHKHLGKKRLLNN